MKVFSAIVKICVALAAVAGAAYLLATYGDKIVAWAKKLCSGCCKAEEVCDAECVEEAVEESVEEPTEEPAPVEEAAPEATEEPVADEQDFVD